jgi:multiple sugar transport system permease protein
MQRTAEQPLPKRKSRRIPGAGIVTFLIKLDIPDRALALLLLAPAAFLVIVFALLPIAQGVLVSLNRVQPATLEQTFVGFQNYETILTSSVFWESMWRTLVYVVISNVATLLLGLGISLLLHQELVGRNLARGIVLFPYLVPAIVIALTWRYMLDPTLGVINAGLTNANLIDRPIPFLARPDTAMLVVIFAGIWKYTPFMIIMFLARLQVIPTELEEAARLDGASNWQLFRYITLPWLMPVIIIALLLRTIWTFNEFEMVYLFAFGGPLFSTTTLPVYVRYLAIDARNLGQAAATATVMLVLLLVMAWGYFRVYARAERDLY